MKNILFAFLLFCINISFSQDSFDKLDYKSIRDNFFKSINDREKFKLANLYLQKATKENEQSRITKGYYLFAKLYYETNPKKSIYYLNKVILNSNKLNDNTFLCIAITEKAYKLYQLRDIKGALDNFLLAEKTAKIIKSDHYLYLIKQYIGLIKSEELGEIDEALVLYNESISYFKKNLKDNEKIYLELLFDKADAFKAKKMIDSSSFYNLLGYKEAMKYDKKIKVLFTLNEGANIINKKEYIIALDSIDKSIPILTREKNYGNLLAAFFYKAKCFKELKNTKEAIKNFIKVDSLRIINKEIDPEFMEGYPYLINYYKEIGDFKNQLKYLAIFNDIEKKFKKRYRESYKTIKERYEIPNLIEEKDEKIGSYRTFIYLFVIISFFSILLAARYYLVLKRNNRKFKELLEESFKWQSYPLQLENGEIIDVENVEGREIEIVKHEGNKSKEINPDIINLILIKLSEFEKNKEFLKKSITSQSLANDFNTNSKYISKVINDYKNCKVNEYINMLRIEYAVLILQKDKKVRKYNLEALADEFGFNNVESFNSAFLRKTGIKPSYFLKNLKT